MQRSVNQPDSLKSLVAPIPKEKQPSETGLDREETFEPVAKLAKTTDIGSTSSGIAKKGKGKGKGRGKSKINYENLSVVFVLILEELPFGSKKNSYLILLNR